jgi:hypothetical protein
MLLAVPLLQAVMMTKNVPDIAKCPLVGKHPHPPSENLWFEGRLLVRNGIWLFMLCWILFQHLSHEKRNEHMGSRY